MPCRLIGGVFDAMSVFKPLIFELHCHPATPSRALRAVHVALDRRAQFWHLDYFLIGDVTQIVLPARAQPGFADRLWQHSCGEAFIAPQAGASYREFNFSPSGQWAIYDFTGERQGGQPLSASISPPRVGWRQAADALVLSVDFSADLLPSHGPWLWGLCAVIEEASPTWRGRSHWALAHHSPQPDFHRRQSWIVELPTEAERCTI